MGGVRLGVWDWHVHNDICKRDNQQESTVYHKELWYSVINPNGEIIFKRTEKINNEKIKALEALKNF